MVADGKGDLGVYDAEQRLGLTLYIYAFKGYDLAGRLRLFENYCDGQKSV